MKYTLKNCKCAMKEMVHLMVEDVLRDYMFIETYFFQPLVCKYHLMPWAVVLQTGNLSGFGVVGG